MTPPSATVSPRNTAVTPPGRRRCPRRSPPAARPARPPRGRRRGRSDSRWSAGSPPRGRRRALFRLVSTPLFPLPLSACLVSWTNHADWSAPVVVILFAAGGRLAVVQECGGGAEATSGIGRNSTANGGPSVARIVRGYRAVARNDCRHRNRDRWSLAMGDLRVRACLITNPRAGRGAIDLAPVLDVLQAHGWETEVREKERGGHATELAREAVADGVDVVVGCGGDGTLSEIVDGLVGTDVALGAIPGGTANLWAGEVGISSRPETAARQLVGAHRRRVDVGRVTVEDRTRKHFLLMAGLGLDAAIMGRVNKRLKKRIGKAAVAVAAARALPSFRAFPVELDLDGVRWEGRVDQVVIGNTRRYGGFTKMTADAYADDGLLDVCVLPAAGPVAAGRQIGSLLIHQRPRAAGAVLDRAARIAIRTPAIV